MPEVGQNLRRVAAGLLTWVLTFGVVGVAVHPERCGSFQRSEVSAAADAAVGWLSANITNDGMFTYRYDLKVARDLGGYSEPRHAGAMLALYQAANHGFVDAQPTADKALSWALDRVVDTPIGPAFGVGTRLETGSTALLVAALVERRLLTGSDEFDSVILDMAATLVATVGNDGAVDAVIDTTTGPISERSRFYTGETLWALARLHLSFPGRGFDRAALRIRRYLISARDAVEKPWPPISDHWGAYAVETMARWPQPPARDAAEDAWVDRQLWMLGLQVRYESQRVGGITRLTRGDVALPAGVGTLGEAFGNFLILDSRNGILGDRRAVLQERATCATWLLLDRQSHAVDADGNITDSRVDGAWFRQGVSQLDDQQHTLSTLLFTLDWMET